jgi:uncharacterized membrane protein YcfT
MFPTTSDMMPADDGFVTALRAHERWADFYPILSIVLVVGLMVAVALRTDQLILNQRGDAR